MTLTTDLWYSFYTFFNLFLQTEINQIVNGIMAWADNHIHKHNRP